MNHVKRPFSRRGALGTAGTGALALMLCAFGLQPLPAAMATSSAPRSAMLSEAPTLRSPIVRGEVLSPAAWGEHTVMRLGGADRYEAAVSVTKDTYSGSVDSVIVASGEGFADALSAAPLSAKLQAPLLLVEGNRIPDVVAAELTRLHPAQILLVGGPGSVSPAVQTSLEQFAPTVVRIWGSDRYTTSVELSKFGWPNGSDSAFVADGMVFADALSSAAAAAKLGGPILLLPGSDTSLPSSTHAELGRLSISKAYIAGGPASVSPAIEQALAAPERTITRFGGRDRFEVSANITSAIFDDHTDVYWANGSAFADALAGSAAAGARGAALLLVDGSCVPSSVYAASDKLLPGSTTILGGSGTLSDGVRNGNECMTRPPGMSEADWSAAQTLYSSVNEARFVQGLGGLRIAGGSAAAAPQDRALRLANGSMQTSDSSQAPSWVRYQVSAVSGVATNRAQRTFDLMRSYSGTARWLYQPNGGVRGFVGVGFSTSGGKSGAVLYFGAGLE